MYIARFRLYGSSGSWWYYGPFEMATTDKVSAVHFKTADDAIETVARRFQTYDIRVERA